MGKSLLLLAVLAGCATTEANPTTAIGVELSSVTLADDCGRPPPAPAKPALPARRAPGSAVPGTPSVAPADCAEGGCGRSRCDQTSMQLAFKAPAGIKATAIKIKRVELLDPRGKVLEVLTPRAASRWSVDANAYVAWTESVGASETVQAMYELSSPNWDKLTNGRWSAHSKTFQLRVTVAIGTANKTVEKQSITPARLAPAVPT